MIRADRRRPRADRRPSLERLDDRCLLTWGLDPTFAAGAGFLTANPGNAGVSTIALQPWDANASGPKLLVTTNYSINSTTGNDFGLWRYNGDGTPDASFGAAGFARVDFDGKNNWPGRIVLDASSRKIYVVGQTIDRRGVDDIAVARLNSNGTLDTSFGAGGKATFELPMPKRYSWVSDLAKDAAVDSNGRLVIVGQTLGFQFSYDAASFVMRLTTAGALDSSFGNRGVVLGSYSTSSNNSWERLRIGPGNTITTVGADDGPATATFSATGTRTARNLLSPSGLIGDGGWLFQPDGKMVVYVSTSAGAPSYGNISLARYLPNGQLDASFGIGGTVTTDVGGPILGYTVDNTESPAGITLDAAGNILVVGRIYTRDADSTDGLIVRYTPSGSLDTSFGTGGAILARLSATTIDGLNAVVVQPDGKLVVGGYVDVDPSSTGRVDNVLLARYADDGSTGSMRPAAFSVGLRRQGERAPTNPTGHRRRDVLAPIGDDTPAPRIARRHLPGRRAARLARLRSVDR
jgi:uncharacterized delta-60 repeat protein